jgi:hypothetical protein
MRKMLGVGAAAALLTFACPTGEAKAQYFGFGVGGYGGPYNSGYGIYAPGYSQGLSLGGGPYYGGYGVPYSYGAYRPYYGGYGYGYRPYYGGFSSYRPYGYYGGYRGGFYGRRW